MNQGIPFARTIRALDADNFRAANLTWLLAVLVLAAWIWWAFAARVPQYETSTDVHFDPLSETAIVYFQNPSRAPIRTGQKALLHSNSRLIPADVAAVTPANDGQLRVILRLSRVPSQLSPPAAAEIETERVSPAAIALRTAGLKD